MNFNHRLSISIFFLLFTSALVGGLILSSAQAHESSPELESRIQLDKSTTTSEQEHTPVVMKENTKVLSTATTQHLVDLSADGQTYTFSEMTSELTTVSAGDIILGEPSPLAPYGFLRKVIAANTVDGHYVLETAEASLLDAVQSASVTLEQTLTPADVQHSDMPASVTPRHLSDSEFFTYRLKEFLLYDEDGDTATTSDQIMASGGITVELTYEFDMEINENRSLTFMVEMTETSDLMIEAGDLTFFDDPNIEHTLLEYTFDPINIEGIMFTPKLDLVIGVSGQIGELEAPIRAGISQELSIQAGVIYADGNLETEKEFFNSFDHTTPELLSGTVDLRAYSRGTLTLMIANIEAINYVAEPYLELKSDPENNIFWELSGGLDTHISPGDSFKFLGNILPEEIIFIEFREILADSGINFVHFVHLPMIRK